MKLIIDIPEEEYKMRMLWAKSDNLCSPDTMWIARGVPYEERSQGEWIDCSEDYGYVECPVCKHLTTCYDNKDELHYCWYCGSKMGKGSAE